MNNILVISKYPFGTNKLIQFFRDKQYDIRFCKPDISIFLKIFEEDFYCLILDFQSDNGQLMNDINQIVKIIKPSLPVIALLDEKEIGQISQLSQSGIFYTFIRPAGLADIELLEKALQRYYQNLDESSISSPLIKMHESLNPVSNFRKVNPRIALLITNDPEIRNRFSLMLHEIDATYIIEKDMVKAVLQILQYPFHLIIFDANENLVESKLFIKIIKSIRPRLHILVTISELIMTKAETFLTSGATKVIIKKPSEAFDLNYADAILEELNSA